MKLYVRPKEAMERVVGGIDPTEHMPAHPSLAFHDLIKKLGNFIPQSPKDVTVMQRRLIRAGIRNENALKILYGAKAALGITLPLITALAVMPARRPIRATSSPSILAAAAVGFFGPNEYVRRMASQASEGDCSRACPMRSTCWWSAWRADWGSTRRSCRFPRSWNTPIPEISEEFGLVNLELKAGKRRVEALRNLAERTGVDDLKKLVAVLIQADRFGTGVAQSLRAHADFMRIQARQVAEEKAAKLGVKLIFPIFFCILPSLFVVTVGPVAMKIIRELIPMMNNI